MSTSDVFAPFRGLTAYTCETTFVTRVNSTEQRGTTTGPRKVWDLELELTDAEMAQVDAFFAARSGAYDSFVFLDPLDNLLAWSEDLSQDAWQATDPSSFHMEGQRLINTGPLPNVLSQAVPAAGVQLTGSISLRDATAPVTLRLTGAATAEVTPGAAWTRYTLTGAGTGWEIELPAGASVDATAAQVITGPAPGNYLRTGAKSGFRAGSYFADALQHRALGKNRNRVRIRIACVS